MRLNKYLAHCGVTSRRKADDLISQGRVRLNGLIVREFGVDVTPGEDRITVDSRVVTLPEKYQYFLLHKPADVISSVDDPQGRETVVDLIDTSRRIYPVGRLDVDVTGVLLLTDDGDLTNQLTHPSNQVPRTYEVTYRGQLPGHAPSRLSQGVEIGEALPARGDLKILWQKKQQGAAQLTLTAGRYHEVKKIFKLFRCPAQSIHRVKFANLQCGNLSPGEYRPLTAEEIQQLKSRG